MDNKTQLKSKFSELTPEYINFSLLWLGYKIPLEEMPSEENYLGILYGFKFTALRKCLHRLKDKYLEVEPLYSELLNELFLQVELSWSPFTATQYFEEEHQKNFIRKIFTKHFYNEPLQALRKEINILERILKGLEWQRKPQDGNIEDKDIALAKQRPLASLVGEKPNLAGFIHCPVHTEKTPSCKIYEDNRWHCFGCSAGGDTIDFIMKTRNLDFINAVKAILTM